LVLARRNEEQVEVTEVGAFVEIDKIDEICHLGKLLAVFVE
jgi:hypothetical protein